MVGNLREVARLDQLLYESAPAVSFPDKVFDCSHLLSLLCAVLFLLEYLDNLVLDLMRLQRTGNKSKWLRLKRTIWHDSLTSKACFGARECETRGVD